MKKTPDIIENSIQSYRKRAGRYDFFVKIFNLFNSFGFDIPKWRRHAIQELNLKRGDIVVDIGCGTGSNFPLIEEIIGPEGKIIGVDLSQEMLDQAQCLIAKNNWNNIQLVQSDAAKFKFPTGVNGVISAFTFTLVPSCGQVIINAYNALMSGGSLVVLDMAWPKIIPLWFRHILFFLRPYGVTDEILQSRPWDIVIRTTKQHFKEEKYENFWMGFFYLISGVKK